MAGLAGDGQLSASCAGQLGVPVAIAENPTNSPLTWRYSGCWDGRRSLSLRFVLVPVLPWRLFGLATQFFSDEQTERLRSYPDIGREELIRFFTLTRKDLGFIGNLGHGGGRGPAARLGLAVQPCTLPWLGFTSGRCRRPRCCGWRISWRCSPACWRSTGGGRRPLAIT